MNRAIITFILFAFSLINAQVKEISEADLYEKAEASIEESNRTYTEVDATVLRDKAYCYYSLLVSNFPKSENFIYYLYSRGSLTRDKAEQKQCFKDVVEANASEYYTRKSYINLCFYAIEERDFATAKQYLDAIGKMGQPTFTCGNEIKIYKLQLENIRKGIEVGMKN